jgi:chaperone modulatory protein CbpM
MKESSTAWLDGLIVEEQVEFTAFELCRATGTSEHQLALWIDQGAIEPKRGSGSEALYFDGVSLRRVRTARRLARDLQINAAGIALALDLLDEIEVLRAQLVRR